MSDRLATFLRRAGPDGWLARALTSDSSPTADLYIGNSMAPEIAAGRLRRLAPTVFAGPGAELVLRHDARAPLLGRVGDTGRGRRIYFIDDAWTAAPRDLSLSRFWRGKMRLVEGRAAAFYLPRARDVVVSTRALLPAARAAAPGAAHHVIDPYWSEPLADAAHFGPEGAPGAVPGCEMVFLGAQLHRADLDFLLPVLRRVLAARPAARLTLSAGHVLPADLDTHPRVIRIPGLRWRDYRAGLAARRFHVALYPLLDTPFNAGRSRNKIIEHAVVGAAPLYSDSWEEGREAAGQGAGLALGPTEDAWEAAILGLIDDRARAAALATAARTHAARINDPAPQRALWTRLFGLADPGAGL